jgi:alpha-tubulin suppressor-like RCC1 family protein
MDFFRGSQAQSSVPRGSAAISLAGVIAAFTLAIASPAHATPNLAQAWGFNSGGELGDGTTGPPSVLPVKVKELSGVTATASGASHTLALLEDGTVMAWGENSRGQLGDGTKQERAAPVAVCLVAEAPCAAEHRLKGVTAISAGYDQSVALLSSGTVLEWGERVGGSATLPVEKTGLPEKAKAIAAGEGVSLALLASGRVMAWGFNGSGQLGNGTTENSEAPVAVCAVGTVGPCPSGPFLEGVKAISAGRFESFAVAVLEGETVVAWGANRFGELGDGTTENRDVPVAVKGLGGVSAVSAGGDHVLALRKSGTVEAWGLNSDGQLGGGTSAGPETCGTPPAAPQACSKKPATVSGPSARVTRVAAGIHHSLAMLENGAVYAWGSNATGQLGDGPTTGPEPCGAPPHGCSATPVPVSNMADAKGIAAGGAFSVAFGPPPTVTTVRVPGGKHGHPPRGPSKGGTTTTVTGLDFGAVSAVKFGGEAASFTVNSPTSITAVSPPHRHGIVDVTVTNVWGTSATSAADHFRYRR